MQLAAKLQDLEICDRPEDQDLIEGIQAALRLVDEDLSGTINDVQTLVDQGQITYSYLWALFPPNTHVHGYDSLTDQHFVAYVRELTYEERLKEGWLMEYVKIKCDIIAQDDTGFGLANYFVEIPQFFGAYSIFELPISPLKCYPEREALREEAIARGKVYANLRMHLYQYQGAATFYVSSDSEFAEDELKLKLAVRFLCMT